MQRAKSTVFVAILIVLGVGLWISFSITKTKERLQIEFDITQNKDMILFSEFGEPPQFAVWLENSETGELKTVFVTYRTAANDWVGKTDCPDSLPLWDSLFKEDILPYQPDMFETSSFYSVTGATPQEGRFKIYAEVDSGSQWICWIEVNLAGDFNQAYPYFSEKKGDIDTHYRGQPAIVYRAVIAAVADRSFKPELYGMSVYENNREQILHPAEGITMAKDIFQSIIIHVTRPVLSSKCNIAM